MVWLAVPLLVFDLTASDGGLVDYGSTGQWEWADPTSGPVGLGPAWGTNPDGLYLHDAQDFLELSLPDLSPVASPTLTLEHWYAIAPGDVGELQLDTGSGFARVDPIGGYPDPAGFVGTSGGYVVDALDLQGTVGPVQVRLGLLADPALADEGWFVRRIVLWDGDVVPPTVTPVDLPVDTQDLAGPYTVLVLIVDDSPIVDARIRWSADGGTEQTAPLVDVGAGLWQAEIPAQSPDTLVSWVAEADDGEQLGRYPAAGEESFRVFLAAPTDLRGPDGPRLVSTLAPLAWTPPASPQPVLAYHVFQEGRATPIVVTDPETRIPVSRSDSQVFSVAAEYPAGLGDLTPPLALDIEVPELLAIEPELLFGGQGAYVTVTGASLYLFDGLSELDLGPGITIGEVEVRDVGQLTARVEVDSDAEVGLRDVVVTGTQGRQSFPSGFEVRSGDDAPRIRQITPESVEQGEALVIQVVATEAFASADLVIEGDEDVLITGPVTVDGKTATFGIAVNTRSRIGAHTLVIDDGANLWTVDLQVDEYVVPPATGCSSTGTESEGWTDWLRLTWARRPPAARRAPASTDP